ncbi:MAG: DivIVA domain-containing protein [Clostridiales bacterium]|nr:DivIVA domain-containing protein [Clostridiales bacterium]
MTEVDNFLDQITQDYRALYAENADLRSKLKILADKINEYRETEDIMRATLYNAQKTANEIVSEAESKREGILDALEQDIRARKTAYDDEIAVCRSQLAEARRQTAEYLAAVQDLTDQQQAFLDNLPDLGQGDELPSDNAAAEAPQAEPVAEEAPAPAEDTIDEMIAQEAAPAAEEESAPQEEPEQPQQEAAAAPAAPASTARIDFSNLKFGKDYEIK